MYRSNDYLKHQKLDARLHSAKSKGRSKLGITTKDLTDEEFCKYITSYHYTGKCNNLKPEPDNPVEGGEDYAYSNIGELLDRGKDPDTVEMPSWVVSQETFIEWVNSRKD